MSDSTVRHADQCVSPDEHLSSSRSHGGPEVHVAEAIGPIARPRTVVVVPDVPKTRSGKILRRLLAELATGGVLGDTTSLQDPATVRRIQAVQEEVT